MAGRHLALGSQLFPIVLGSLHGIRIVVNKIRPEDKDFGWTDAVLSLSKGAIIIVALQINTIASVGGIKSDKRASSDKFAIYGGGIAVTGDSNLTISDEYTT